MYHTYDVSQRQNGDISKVNKSFFSGTPSFGWLDLNAEKAREGKNDLKIDTLLGIAHYMWLNGVKRESFLEHES